MIGSISCPHCRPETLHQSCWLFLLMLWIWTLIAKLKCFPVWGEAKQLLTSQDWHWYHLALTDWSRVKMSRRGRGNSFVASKLSALCGQRRWGWEEKIRQDLLLTCWDSWSTYQEMLPNVIPNDQSCMVSGWDGNGVNQYSTTHLIIYITQQSIAALRLRSPIKVP